MIFEGAKIFCQLLHTAAIYFRLEDCGKVIFLDFDGVLATDDYTDSLLASGKNTQDRFGRSFNPRNIEMLELIIKQTNARIVVTSDWRHFLSLWGVVRMWNYRKLPGKIIGVTPSISIYRGDEIDKWLCKHKGITHYVIIDDMDYKQFKEKQRPHLVTTNHFSGLNKSSAQEAVCVLNCDFSKGHNDSEN